MSLLLLLTPDESKPRSPVGQELGDQPRGRSRFFDLGWTQSPNGTGVVVLPPLPEPVFPELLARRPAPRDLSFTAEPTPGNVFTPLPEPIFPDVLLRKRALPELGFTAEPTPANNFTPLPPANLPEQLARRKPIDFSFTAEPTPSDVFPPTPEPVTPDVLLRRRPVDFSFTAEPTPADFTPAGASPPALPEVLARRRQLPELGFTASPVDAPRVPRPDLPEQLARRRAPELGFTSNAAPEESADEAAADREFPALLLRRRGTADLGWTWSAPPVKLTGSGPPVVWLPKPTITQRDEEVLAILLAAEEDDPWDWTS